AFANRVYPAVSVLDLNTETFQFGPGQTDASDRIQFDWNVPSIPTQNVHYGASTTTTATHLATLRATTTPALGGALTLRFEHGAPGAAADIYVGGGEAALTFMGLNVYIDSGPMYLTTLILNGSGEAQFTLPIPNAGLLEDFSVYFQGAVLGGGDPLVLTNGVRATLGAASGAIPSSTTLRIGQPSRVEISADGRRALVLSRGSEDIAVFDVTGAHPQFVSIFPRRDSTPSPTQLDKNHTPFDAARLIGDRPTGLLLADEGGRNDLATAFVNAETSRDLSILNVSYTTGVVSNPSGTLHKVIPTGSDAFTALEREGSEIFSDASRDQTTGNFNNSCESCHFEGGEDGSVWARPVGPRSTIAMYGGIRRSGQLLWNAARMNLGETGPMFGGENGGTGIFTDTEQEALIAYAEKLPVPLNPNLENADLSVDAKKGRDLFFGTDTFQPGVFNPTLRASNCSSCHTILLGSGDPAWFTSDQIKILDTGLDQAHQDPCLTLKENFMGEAIQDVNSGVNLHDDLDQLIVDRNVDGIPDTEGYTPMNIDKDKSFTRDDPNSTKCPDPNDPNYPDPDLSAPLVFTRPQAKFNIPTKMGVFFTGPYFHDHAVASLRSTIHPASQVFPPLNKLQNTAHDVFGSNVQTFLQSAGPAGMAADAELILKFIQSL
ncbi:MAG TPA: hypothetical protein VKE69_09940, partial [Planctomycetota bacterium]|nr:hypothetical protein [Planctomycetota bacterium]